MPTAIVINEYIIIKPAPEQGDGRPENKGIVKATDNRATCPVKPGQVVFFDRYAGHEIDLGDEKLRVVHEEDIMIVLHVSAEEAAQSQAKREAEAAVEAIAEPPVPVEEFRATPEQISDYVNNSEEDCE